MRTRLTVVAVCAAVAVLATSPLSAQQKRFHVGIRLTPSAKSRADQRLQSIRVARQAEFEHQGIRYTAPQINHLARREFLSSLTLREFLAEITPESQRWLARFYDSFRSPNRPTWPTVRVRYLDTTLSRIAALVRDTERGGRLERRAVPGAPVLLPQEEALYGPARGSGGADGGPAPAARSLLFGATPHVSDIFGSRLTVKHSYSGEQRWLISTPEQSLHLRGRYQPETWPFYPDYDNDSHCNACCGPAAGQSILEWFNVPVRDRSGHTLTTSEAIQGRLSDLMDTHSGFDFTYPWDLAGVLTRDEFAGSKGYCYLPGGDDGGSWFQVDYMLDSGTPVILLIAKEDWAHYVTLYGYDGSRYWAANWGAVSKDELDALWGFDDVDWQADAAYTLTGVNSRTLFSYAPNRCDEAWDYMVPVGTSALWPEVATSWQALYLESFNLAFVDGQDERGHALNFVGRLMFFPLTLAFNAGVASGGASVPLDAPHVIAENAALTYVIPNNSIGRSFTLVAHVDRRFLDTEDQVYCGFFVRNANGETVRSRYELCRGLVTPNASGAGSQNYVVTWSLPYQAGYASAVFEVHGGWRRAEWQLQGCTNDLDGDGICDEWDADMDGDGVPNDTDNCPTVDNPNQADHDGNHIGLMCDFHEQCMRRCADPNPIGAHVSVRCDAMCGLNLNAYIGRVGVRVPPLLLPEVWRLFDPHLLLALEKLRPMLPDSQRIRRDSVFQDALARYRRMLELLNAPMTEDQAAEALITRIVRASARGPVPR